MSLQVINNPNFSSINMVQTRPRDDIADGSAFRVYDVQEKAPTRVKVGVFFTTLAGVLAAMAITLKGKGYSLKPMEFFKGLTHVKYEEGEVEKLVMKLAVGSVGGGLIGGAIFDKKENRKAKYREAIIQLVGNIGTPLACVAGGMRLFKKFEPKIHSAMEKLPESMKFLKSEKGKGIPSVIASACCLITGIFAGNKIGNTINKVVFKCDEKRTLKITDMSPHIDDLGIATSFVVPPESAIGHIITRIIPAALMIAGFSTGVAQERHHHHKHHSGHGNHHKHDQNDNIA